MNLKLKKMNTAKNDWLDLTLVEIIEEYADSGNQKLDKDEVQELSEIIRAKMNLYMENITEGEYNSTIDAIGTSPTIKYLYIELEIQDGERIHTHRLLHETNKINIKKEVNRYASEFWGESEKYNDAWFAYNGEIAIKVEKYKELDEETYLTMKKVMYSYNHF